MKTSFTMVLIVVCTALMLRFDGIAEEQKVVSGSGKSVKLVSEYKTHPGDHPQHEVRYTIREDAHSSGDPDWDQARSQLFGLLDQTSGNGTHSGYQIFTHANGDMSYTRHEGKQSAHPVGGGKFEIHFEGTFEWTGGSGKFQYIRGTGTYKGKLNADGVATYTYEGIANY